MHFKRERKAFPISREGSGQKLPFQQESFKNFFLGNEFFCRPRKAGRLPTVTLPKQCRLQGDVIINTGLGGFQNHSGK
jgi:hypothetical protein